MEAKQEVEQSQPIVEQESEGKEAISQKTWSFRHPWASLAITVGLLVLSWYSSSLLLSMMNKWVFSKDKLDFQFPLFLSSIHMLIQFSLSKLTLLALPRYQPKEQVKTSWKEYFFRAGVCALVTSMDIGLGNISLETITLSFYTMCRSSILVFVFVFSVLFRIERFDWILLCITFIITGGVILMVATETEFVFSGFLFVMASSIMSGLRWALTQKLLLDHPMTSNPFTSLSALTPLNFCILFIAGLILEGPKEFITSGIWKQQGPFMSIVLIVPGTLAFLMIASEFGLIKKTSVVTLSVCGILKEIITIVVSTLFYHDILLPINVIGLVITLIGIAVYNYYRIAFTKSPVPEQESEYIALHERV